MNMIGSESILEGASLIVFKNHRRVKIWIEIVSYDFWNDVE